MLHERVRRAFLDIAEEEPERCVRDRRQPARGHGGGGCVGDRAAALEPMSMAAERSAAALNEPDRLDGFSTPREVDRLFGHDAAIASSTTHLHSGRMHHAWLLVGPEGIGKATLAYRFARCGAGRGRSGCGARRRSIATIRCSARSRRCRIPTFSSSGAPGSRSRNAIRNGSASRR